MSASSDLYLSLQEAEYYQSEEYQLRQSVLPYPAKSTTTVIANTTVNATDTNIQN